MKTEKILDYLFSLYPYELAYEGDFIGLQTGEFHENTKNIVVCLDFDYDVYNKIKNKKIDLIITHHPLIYGERDEVLNYDYIKRKLVETIDSKNIPVLSLHTNFDASNEGMNVTMLKKLGFNEFFEFNEDKILKGTILKKPIEFMDLVKLVKKTFNIPYIAYINRGPKYIKKLAICGGAGSGLFRIAKDNGCDCLISGDAMHHIRHDINCYHYNYIELPHEYEKIFINKIKNDLLKLNKNLNIYCVDTQKIMNLLV